jgi:lipopolysaccharide export system protein LptA
VTKEGDPVGALHQVAWANRANFCNTAGKPQPCKAQVNVKKFGPTHWRLALLSMLSLVGAPADAKPPAGTKSSLVLGKVPRAFQISADHLNLQQSTGRLELRGNVAITTKELDVRAHRLLVLLSKQGTPRMLEATGNVRLRVNNSRGTARRVTLRLDPQGKPRGKPKSRLLELTGGASLKLERGLSVNGTRIAVELDTGRLQVAHPKITVPGHGGGDG